MKKEVDSSEERQVPDSQLGSEGPRVLTAAELELVAGGLSFGEDNARAA
jgi:hypothetical protein